MLCLVCCACRQLLDSLGEGVWARPVAFVYVLLLLINCGRDRRAEGSMLGSRARASVVGPLVTERCW